MTNAVDQRIEDALSRPTRYWNCDGIPEIVLGGFWLMLALVVALPVMVPTAAMRRSQSFLIVLGMFMFGRFMTYAIRAWKQRMTFPRTGYIEIKPSTGQRVGYAAAAAVVALAIAVAIAFGVRSLRDWAAPLTGVLIAVLLVRMSRSMGAPRYPALGIVVALAGMAAMLLHVSEDLGLVTVFAAAGVVCLLDGAIVMRSYLKQHPAAIEEAE